MRILWILTVFAVMGCVPNFPVDDSPYVKDTTVEEIEYIEIPEIVAKWKKDAPEFYEENIEKIHRMLREYYRTAFYNMVSSGMMVSDAVDKIVKKAPEVFARDLDFYNAQLRLFYKNNPEYRTINRYFI